jgi:hypothetical protein
VLPVEIRPERTRPDLDQAYQRQLEMLTRLRRAVADMATARKRLELQTVQLEQLVTRLGEQRIKDQQAGRSDLAAEVGPGCRSSVPSWPTYAASTPTCDRRKSA